MAELVSEPKFSGSFIPHLLEIPNIPFIILTVVGGSSEPIPLLETLGLGIQSSRKEIKELENNTRTRMAFVLLS